MILALQNEDYSDRFVGVLFRKFAQISASLGRLVASDLVGLGRFARPSPLPVRSDVSSVHLRFDLSVLAQWTLLGSSALSDYCMIFRIPH